MARNFALTIAFTSILGLAISSSDAALIGVQSSAGVGATTAVEAVAQAGDDLRNNGTYPDVNDYYLLEFATGHVLSAAYNVEHDGSSLGGVNITDGNNVSGTISAGTKVNSYLFHADSNLGGGGATVMEMTVTFENKIIGLNGGETNGTGGSTHATSFGEFDDVGVTRFPGGAGTFAFAGGDFIVSISADQRTIQVRSQVNNNTGDVNAFDQLWVVTEVPEPSTYLVFGGLMACFGLAGWWRKRRKAA